MGLLEISFSTVKPTSDLRHTHRVADFEDIIRLDYCQPSRWIDLQGTATDTQQTSTGLGFADPRDLRAPKFERKTRSWESAIVCFRRKK